MAGRKLIAINLKSTSPEGEVKFFKSIHQAARELGFSERGVWKSIPRKEESNWRLRIRVVGTRTGT